MGQKERFFKPFCEWLSILEEHDGTDRWTYGSFKQNVSLIFAFSALAIAKLYRIGTLSLPGINCMLFPCSMI